MTTTHRSTQDPRRDKWFNAALIFALVVLPAFFGLKKMPTEMGLQIGALAAALFFVNLEKFVRFKGAGFEAELRAVVDDSYAAIEELKALALCLAAPIVDELAISGRMMQYIHLKHKLERMHKIHTTLRKLGASEGEADETCSTLYERVTADHVEKVLNSLRDANPDKGATFQSLDKNGEGWSKDKLERLIKENDLQKNDECNEALSDLDHFLSTKTLRREDEWQS